MRALLTGAAALWLAAAVPTGALANEEHEHGQSVTMNDLPKPVRTTFENESQGGRVEELRKETKSDGRVVYWGEVVKHGQGTELEVSKSGSVMHRGKVHNESEEPGEHRDTHER
jgi:hypothetical protein